MSDARLRVGGDIFDSRDVVEAIEEIEADAAMLTGGENELPDMDKADLDALRELVEEIDRNAGDNARDGTSVIADWYFEDYAQELAEDIGAIDRDASWPLSYIDWPAAARALQMDYSAIEYDGHTYWVRA